MHDLPLRALLDAPRRREKKEARAHEHDEAVLDAVGAPDGLQNKQVEVRRTTNVREERLRLGLQRVDRDGIRHEREECLQQTPRSVVAVAHGTLEVSAQRVEGFACIWGSFRMRVLESSGKRVRGNFRIGLDMSCLKGFEEGEELPLDIRRHAVRADAHNLVEHADIDARLVRALRAGLPFAGGPLTRAVRRRARVEGRAEGGGQGAGTKSTFSCSRKCTPSRTTVR